MNEELRSKIEREIAEDGIAATKGLYVTANLILIELIKRRPEHELRLLQMILELKRIEQGIPPEESK
jgi:hypothetical protein